MNTDLLREDERKVLKWFLEDAYPVMAPNIEVILSRLCEARAETEALRGQIPHTGDGSCDNCGAVPAVDIPTSLCHECRDGVKRAEIAEAEKYTFAAEQLEAAAKDKAWTRKYGIGGLAFLAVSEALKKRAAELRAQGERNG